MLTNPQLGQRVLLKGKAFDINKPQHGTIVWVSAKSDPYVDVLLDLGFRCVTDKDILEEVQFS